MCVMVISSYIKLNQAELNNCVINLNLPNESALIVGSRLRAKHKNKNLLGTDTTFAWYMHRDSE